MALQFDHVIEGVCAAQLASVDEGHEQVADLSAIQRAIVESILAMQNCSLQGSFYDVVVQWGSGLAKEQGQGQPVPQQIPDRLAEPGVRLCPPLRQLHFQPGMQRVHHRGAAFLMELQTLIRRQSMVPRFGIMAVDQAKHFQHIAAFAREVLRHVYKLPSSMRQAVGQKDLGPGVKPRDIAR